MPGGKGSAGSLFNGVAAEVGAGNGGNSLFGFGGVADYTGGSSTLAGVAGSNYGGGGSGSTYNNIAANVAGADGAPGVVLITEFCIA
jgi:hypothetical protein